MGDPVTANARTRGFYERIVAGLVKDAGVELVDARGVGAALSAALEQRHVSRSSWKTYAAAVRSVLLALGYDRARAGLEEAMAKTARPATRRRAAIKFVPSEIEAAILAALAKREWKYSRHLAVLIIATSATGLRPKEWRDASLVTGEDVVLVVQNGKFKPMGSVNERSVIRNARRGNGATRSLHIEPDGQDYLVETIRELLRWERVQPWAKAQRDLRRELKAVVKALVEAGAVPRLFLGLTPYSFRHQAAADAKATFDVGRGEAAAVLGHASARTAVASYGRPRMGRSGMRVRPSKASVERVDNLDVGRESLVQMIARREEQPELSDPPPLPAARKPEG